MVAKEIESENRRECIRFTSQDVNGNIKTFLISFPLINKFMELRCIGLAIKGQIQLIDLLKELIKRRQSRVIQPYSGPGRYQS